MSILIKINKELVQKNSIGYFSFIFENVEYYISEGMLSKKGQAFGFSSQLDETMYFITSVPSERLKVALEYAKQQNILIEIK